MSWAACRAAPRVGVVACRPAPPPRLPHLAPRPLGPGRRVSPEKAEPRQGPERGARATGPRAGPAYSAAGAGARDGAAAAPSAPRPSAEGLVAGGGRLAGEDPGRGGLADWGPRAITQPYYPESPQSVPEPRHRVYVCVFGLTPGLHGAPQSCGQFSTAAPGSDMGDTAAMGCSDTGTACCLPHKDGAAI